MPDVDVKPKKMGFVPGVCNQRFLFGQFQMQGVTQKIFNIFLDNPAIFFTADYAAQPVVCIPDNFPLSTSSVVSANAFLAV